MAHIYGMLQLPTAGQRLACARKDACEMGGYILPGTLYVNIINNKRLWKTWLGKEPPPPPTGRKYHPTFYRRMHMECFPEWAEYVVRRRFEWMSDPQNIYTGRPVGRGSVASLSQEEQKYRKKLRHQLTYLMGRCQAAEEGSLAQLRLVGRLLDIAGQINETGAPILQSMSRQNSKRLRANEIIVSFRCLAKNDGSIHQLAEDYHCINCGKCYSPTHIHIGG